MVPEFESIVTETGFEWKEHGGWTPSFGPKDKVSDRTERAKIIPEDRDSASGGQKFAQKDGSSDREKGRNSG